MLERVQVDLRSISPEWIIGIAIGGVVAGVKAIQKLNDHIVSCDKRYGELKEVSNDRHQENLAKFERIERILDERLPPREKGH